MAETSAILQYIRDKLGSRELKTQKSRRDDIVILERPGLGGGFGFFKKNPQLGFHFLWVFSPYDYWRKKVSRFYIVI